MKIQKGELDIIDYGFKEEWESNTRTFQYIQELFDMPVKISDH